MSFGLGRLGSGFGLGGSMGGGGGVDPLAPGVPGALANQSADTDVTPTIRIPLNTDGGALSNIADDVMHLYVSGSSIANKTLDATDISNGYVDLTSTERRQDTSFTARSIRDGTHNSPVSSALAVAFDWIDTIWYGQSNNLVMFSAVSSPPSASEGTSVWDNTNSVWATPPNADGIRTALNQIKSLTGRPVRAVYGGQAGVAILQLMKGQGTGYYETLLARVAASGISPNFIYWQQGEGDGNTASPSYLTYSSRLDTLHGDIATDSGKSKATCPLICSGLATVTDGGFSQPDANWTEIQKALIYAAETYTNIYYSHSNLDATLSDGIHFDGASAGRAGARWAQMVAKINGDVSTDAAWFIASAAVVDGTHTDVTVTHDMGTDFTPTTSITGFTISDDNFASEETPSDAAQQSATVIRLTHSDFGTVNDRQIRYQYGKAPDITGVVLDNGSLTAPLVCSANQDITAEGSGALPVPTFLSSGNTGASTQSQSRTGVGIGTASATRRLLIGVTANNAGTLSTLQVAPGTGTPVNATKLVDQVTGGRPHCSIWLCDMPDDTTADFNLTFAANPFATARVHVWSIDSSTMSSATPVDTDKTATAAGTVTTLEMDSSAGGFILVVGGSENITSNPGAMSGDETYAERVEVGNSGIMHYAADASGISAHTGDQTVTLTWTKTADCSMAAVTMR